MKRGQFRDPGAMITSWSLTQKVAGLNNLLNRSMILFVTEFSEFTENIIKSILMKHLCLQLGTVVLGYIF